MEANAEKTPRGMINAHFSVTSTLSQAVLTVFALASTIPLVTGLYFIWHDKQAAWIALLFSTFLITLVSIGWRLSQRMIDMANASPTQITDCHGNTLITDTRVLESKHALKQLTKLLQLLDSRSPPQEPDRLGNTQEKGDSAIKEQANQPTATCAKVITIEPDRSD